MIHNDTDNDNDTVTSKKSSFAAMFSLLSRVCTVSYSVNYSVRLMWIYHWRLLWAAKSCMAACFCQSFSRRLFTYSEPRSRWNEYGCTRHGKGVHEAVVTAGCYLCFVHIRFTSRFMLIFVSIWNRQMMPLYEIKLPNLLCHLILLLRTTFCQCSDVRGATHEDETRRS